MKNKILLSIIFLIVFCNYQACKKDLRITNKNFLVLVKINECKKELLALEAKPEKTPADLAAMNNLKKALESHDQEIDDVIARLKKYIALGENFPASSILALQFIDSSSRDGACNNEEKEAVIQALEGIKSANLNDKFIKNLEKKLSNSGRLFYYIWYCWPASQKKR